MDQYKGAIILSEINILDKQYFENICKLYDYFCEYYRTDARTAKLPKFKLLLHNSNYSKKVLDNCYAAMLSNVLGFEIAGAFQSVDKGYNFGIDQVSHLIKSNMNLEGENFDLTADTGEFITTIRNVFAHSTFKLQTGRTGNSQDVLIDIDVKNKLKTQISLQNLVKVAGYIDTLANISMSNKSNLLNTVIFKAKDISSMDDIDAILDSVRFISIEGLSDGSIADYEAEIEKLKKLGLKDEYISDIVSQMKQFQINNNIENFKYHLTSLSDEQKGFYRRLFSIYGITDISKLNEEQQEFLIKDTITNISMQEVYRNNHIAIDNAMYKSNPDLDKYGEVLDVESPIYYSKMTILKSFFILSYINNKSNDRNENFSIDYDKIDIGGFINTSLGKSSKERRKEKILENAQNQNDKEKAQANLNKAISEKQSKEYFFDLLRHALAHSSERVFFNYSRFFETKRKEDIRVVFYQEDEQDKNNPILYTEISIGRLNKLMKSIEDQVKLNKNIER